MNIKILICKFWQRFNPFSESDDRPTIYIRFYFSFHTILYKHLVDTINPPGADFTEGINLVSGLKLRLLSHFWNILVKPMVSDFMDFPSSPSLSFGCAIGSNIDPH